MTEKAVKKLHIVTHGCQMNEYDSARMQDLLGDSHAMVATDNAADADVILLNTCSIREKARLSPSARPLSTLFLGPKHCIACQK
jgi:tRNA A37 methylthiotransferase MiaB